MRFGTVVRNGVVLLVAIVAMIVTGSALPVPSVAQTKPVPSAVLPQPPRVLLNLNLASQSGPTVSVPAGGNFQAALNSAVPGETIILQAGATYVGPFTLPAIPNPNSQWIYIKTSAYNQLPPPGTRVSPANAPQMAVITVGAGVGAAIQTAPGANHFRFFGIEVTPKPGAFVYDLVDLGMGTETSVAQLPSFIFFSRCYFNGDPTVGTIRGIGMNGASVAVNNSYFSNFKNTGQDTQAIAGWNGPGPFAIINNYLEGAGENVLFGGADATIPNLVPSDIQIEGNLFNKPLTWDANSPTYTGTLWNVKNLLELKNAQRVLITGNVFQYNWVQGQAGYSILFTVRNQSGGNPWATVSDVTFMDNVVQHAAGGFDMLGTDDDYPSGPAQRILIQNNLLADISSSALYGQNGIAFLLDAAPQNVVIDHNTVFQTNTLVVFTPPPGTIRLGVPVPLTPGFVFTNNIAGYQTYGIGGDGTYGNAALTLSTYCTNPIVIDNVIAIENDPDYAPPSNYFVATMSAVGFVHYDGGINSASANYTLAASSPYLHVGTNNSTPGVNIAGLGEAMDSVITGSR
jgi:hypothetical protein